MPALVLQKLEKEIFNNVKVSYWKIYVYIVFAIIEKDSQC